MEIDSIIIGNWEQDIIDHVNKRYSVTFTDPTRTEYYFTGDTVMIKSDFKEMKKFVGWNSSIGEGIFQNKNRVSTFFIMPNKDISIIANYAHAPYKLVIHKPGNIADPENPELLLETDTKYVRYYDQNDKINIEAPSELFGGWQKSDKIPSDIYTVMSRGGGYTKSSTWFHCPAYDVELKTIYNPDPSPYWTTQKTNKGWLEANFIERVNTQGSITVPGGYTFYRPLTIEEKRVIMRALNILEQTFAIAPRRTISLNFVVINILGLGVAAATDPIIAEKSQSYDSPKEKWLSSDFNGRATGEMAAISKIEAVWRDQQNIDPQEAGYNNSFIGYRDGTIVLNHNIIHSWNKEDPNKILPSQFDLQSTIMHELGHNVCYFSINGQKPMFSALDVFVVNKHDHSKSLINGNMETVNGDEAIILNETVKGSLGYYLQVVSGPDNRFDFGHLYTQPGLGVGSQYRASGTTRGRKFADFELVLFQEMGWKINPNAWSKNR